MHFKHKLLITVIMAATPAAAAAVTLPGGADVSRIKPFAPAEAGMPAAQQAPSIHIPKGSAAPREATSIRFVLNKVIIKGNAALAEAEFSSVYTPYLGKQVTLDVAWAFAEQMTEEYRKAGYFLSRVYVPAQQIDDGVLQLEVVEGAIGQVVVEGPGQASALVTAWVERIKQARPARIQDLEEALLELSSVSGFTWRAVLEPDKAAGGHTVLVKLISSPRPSESVVRIDNQGSRYLGPYQAGWNYTTSLLPGHVTSLMAVTSLPTDELQNVALMHSMAVAPRWGVDVRASYAHAEPGYTLAVQEIESRNLSVGAGVSYQWVRQRNQALSSRVGVDWVKSTSDILQTPLARDEVRVARLSQAYAVADRWAGQNVINATLSQGLPWLGASKSGQSNLSRSQAKPDFRKLELQVSRLQAVGAGFSMQLSAAGQAASGPLYASEEFGYGGTALGRAYDSSELVGDNGFSAGAELRYAGIDGNAKLTPVPYLFYDFGQVWNDDSAQAAKQTGSTAGLGSYFNTAFGVGGNISMAWPLSHAPSAPIYGHHGSAPRLRVETNYRF